MAKKKPKTEVINLQEQIRAHVASPKTQANIRRAIETGRKEISEISWEVKRANLHRRVTI